MNRLDGKVALISGAARGIGAATARLMAEAGARVTMSKKPFRLALAAAVFLLASASLSVAQPTLTLLYSFAGPPDGAGPSGGPVMDGAGNLYGTTTGGGIGAYCGASSVGCGTVFRLAPDGTEAVLYSFCSQPGCADGAGPQGGLIMDAAGNLYGTTYGGGDANQGTVFSVAPDGTEAVLYSFCTQPGCTDGAEPLAGLILGPRGNLFGTTYSGGAGVGTACGGFVSVGCGTVFELSHNLAKTKWREKVLYSFCAQLGCADGFGPQGRLILFAGHLWGTTRYGGIGLCDTSAGCGAVFTLARGTGTEMVLYSFCSQPGCADGEYPTGGLVMDAAGNLYGTTAAGGTGYCFGFGPGCGTVFRLAPDGSETVLHTFQRTLSGNPTPSNVVADAAGNLYGTISRNPPPTLCKFACPPPSPPPSPGEAYEIQSDGRFRSLGTLPPEPSDLVLDDLGNLYGETVLGGTGPCGSGEGCGTVFELIP